MGRKKKIVEVVRENIDEVVNEVSLENVLATTTNIYKYNEEIAFKKEDESGDAVLNVYQFCVQFSIPVHYASFLNRKYKTQTHKLSDWKEIVKKDGLEF